MRAITSVNVATAITKLVAVDALPALMGNLVVGNLVARSFEPFVAQAGDSVEFTMAGPLIALNGHSEATFQVPDITKVLAVPDLLKLYMEPAVVALAEKIETDLLGLRSQFVANPCAVDISENPGEVIDGIETYLFKAGVTAGQPKYLIVDADLYSVLRRSPRFIEYMTAGDAGLRAYLDGSIGKIGQVYIFRSIFAPRDGGGMAFTKNAIGLVTRRLPQPLPGTGAIADYAELGNFGMRVMMDYRPDTRTQEFTISVLYGCAVLHNSWGVQVEY